MALGHSAFAEAPIASAAGVSATVAVTGLPITSAHGSLSVVANSVVENPTGQQANTAVGSVTPEVKVILSISVKSSSKSISSGLGVVLTVIFFFFF